MFYRSQKRIITSEMLEGGGDGPAPLNLPLGKLFFGYAFVPYSPPPTVAAAQTSNAFIGGGNTLSGRRIVPNAPEGDISPEGLDSATPASAHSWGSGGQALGSAGRPPKPKEKKKARKGGVIETD